jgi:hypothetical protein
LPWRRDEDDRRATKAPIPKPTTATATAHPAMLPAVRPDEEAGDAGAYASTKVGGGWGSSVVEIAGNVASGDGRIVGGGGDAIVRKVDAVIVWDPNGPAARLNVPVKAPIGIFTTTENEPASSDVASPMR